MVELSVFRFCGNTKGQGRPPQCLRSPPDLSFPAVKPAAARRISQLVVLQLVLVLGACCILPGCSGCLKKDASAKKDGDKEKEKQEKERNTPKPDFELEKPRIEPSDGQVGGGHFVKPGHWISVTQKMKANNFNFNGELYSASTDGLFTPVSLERLPFAMTSVRPVAMPKGQAKHFDLLYFVPRRSEGWEKRPWLMSSLRAKRGGREHRRAQEPVSMMQPFHFFFVVLASSPDAYAKLDTLDSIRPPPQDSLDYEGRDLYYRVKRPRIDEKRVPLPAHPLTWTTIAYVLWDDIDPDVFSLDQRKAMLDWLHWGGRLIVSGPRSLEKLRGSFLEPYLPVQGASNNKLDQASFQEINEFWSIGPVRPGTQLKIVEGQPLEGLRFELAEEANFVLHTGELLAERHVGRGRIVVTGFALTERTIVNWKHFDGFFNACILRRPARRYEEDHQGGKILHWAEFRKHRQDPRLVSNLRYFSRDARFLPPDKRKKGNSSDLDPGFHPTPQSGVAGWTDFSAVANAARSSLRNAAGIAVPKADFVLKVLGVYLLVLVPINWTVFRLMGRVEWAWGVVPVASVVCAAVVVHLAELNIGFARSRSEVGVLEIQADYPRAHLTRFTALYSSLSSRYELTFDDKSALAQPFALSENFRMLTGQVRDTVQMYRGKQVHLTGFRVKSNSTGMLHSEQMLALGGSLRLNREDLKRWVVSNDTHVALRDAGVVRMTQEGLVQWAWIGELKPNTSETVKFEVSDEDKWPTEWDRSPVTRAQALPGEISLHSLFRIASQPLCLQPGDVKLIAWTNKKFAGFTLRPRVSQATLRTLVLAHLCYGPDAEPRPDLNTKDDV